MLDGARLWFKDMGFLQPSSAEAIEQRAEELRQLVGDGSVQGTDGTRHACLEN